MTKGQDMSFFQTNEDRDYAVAIAESGFILDLQMAIESALDRRGLSQADLARLMGVSEPRVSKMMSDSGANLRARTIGRVGAALGLKACVRFEEPESASLCQPISLSDWIRGDTADTSPAWGRAAFANDHAWEELEHVTRVGAR